MPLVAADACIDSLGFRSCIPWLDRSTGADHRSRAFQLTPSVALSFIHSFIHSFICGFHYPELQHNKAVQCVGVCTSRRLYHGP